MSIIEDYVAYARSVRYKDIPPEIVHLIKMLIVDTVGVACHAAKSDTVKRFMQYVDGRPDLPQATAIAQGRKVSLADAALLNGIMAHVDDYDEVSLPGHAGVVMIPAILALGEHYKASGEKLLHACILGLELEYRLAEVMREKMWEIGWHTTPAFGTLGSAAISALVMDLNQDEFANALALAASQASGLQANFGTMAKPFHAGMAASKGIECALLAKCGIVANPLVLEDPKGYMDCFSTGIEKPAKIDFYNGWSIAENGMRFKKYPCCVGSHSSIETMKLMAARHGFNGDDIVSITTGISPSSYACMQYALPQNALEAKFSMSFPLAMVLQNGDLRTRDFSDQVVTVPATQELMKKITVELEQKYTFRYLHPNKPCILRVLLKDGRSLEQEGEYRCTGITDITDDELYTKYMDCTHDVLPDENAKAAYQSFMNLEAENDIISLMKLIY